MQTITSALQRTLQVRGKSIATNFNGVLRSWNEVSDRVSRLAGVFLNQGAERGDRIACLALNSDRYLEYYLATAWANCVLVQVNTRLAAAEVVYWLSDSGSRVLLVDDNFLHMLPEIRNALADIHTLIYMGDGETPEACLNYEVLIATCETLAPAESSPDDLAALYYTGGTTGRSKGVMLSHSNLCYNAMQTLAVLNWVPHDHYLHAAPMFHIADGIHTLISIILGTTNSFVPAFDPESVMMIIQENRITCSIMVPTMIGMLVNHPKVEGYDMSSLRGLNYGASPMPEAVIERAIEIFPDVDLIQAYGQTEASPVLTLLRPEHHVKEDPKLRSAGQAIPGVTLSIRDELNKELVPGLTGEICARGGNVMQGYYGMPEATAEALKGGWLHTGDSGYLDEDGFLFVVDRVKDMIVSGGENVYSQETENAIYQHPAVLECAVIGIPHEKWGEQVHAIVRLKPEQQLDEEELIKHCKTLIADYKCPRSMTLREAALPLSGAGKVLKKDLRAPYWKDMDKSVN